MNTEENRADQFTMTDDENLSLINKIIRDGEKLIFIPPFDTDPEDAIEMMRRGEYSPVAVVIPKSSTAFDIYRAELALNDEISKRLKA